MKQFDISLSVVIPTYNRGEVLLDTISMLLKQQDLADEIIVIDQTDYHEGSIVLKKLKFWHQEKNITFVHLEQPSIPSAMNVGLSRANSSHVLFLDDDVEIDTDFITKHKLCIEKDPMVPAHVGQVLQPGEIELSYKPIESKSGILKDLEFKFNFDTQAPINNCIACNLCVNKSLAISVGGFDCNFVGSAYRFETEFAKRLARSSSRSLMFYPEPRIKHLKAEAGGTRAKGHFLTVISSHHSVGDYYYALLEAKGFERWRYIVHCWFRSIVAKFYLRKPQYIPVRLIAETKGLILAFKLYRQGQKLID